MPNKINEEGNKYGRVTVIRDTGERRATKRIHECLCDCGTVFTVKIDNLKSGNTKSCGCLQSEFRERRSKEMTTHGKSRTYEYEKGLYLKKKYGISLEDFLRMKEKAGGEKCQICGKLGNVHIDHDHLTGQIRGLLCPPCNKALGLMKDNMESLENAINYLKTTRGEYASVRI